MFLNLLSEKEGKNFLQLATIAMKVNGIIEEREKAVFQTYRLELGIHDYKLQNKELTDLVTAFQASTKKVKRAIIIELSGVLNADEEIDIAEENWILKLGNEWGFRDSEVRKMIRWAQDFNDLLAEGYEYINK
ncbi:hypothetical protein [Clostridium omnivorum]|uniref:Co-chaperone DjlA N-terminal domain-containing protein n=1 Tax=Clostridium omnivorum TaxID=1604902 RepID=A0ABQ5N7N2_9CLOT|nr:hypothetical protein [Clostridium sp. E14]GLC31141.1 hypothetical protein bsdE14_25510 [Clostridium sp. E14]